MWLCHKCRARLSASQSTNHSFNGLLALSLVTHFRFEITQLSYFRFSVLLSSSWIKRLLKWESVGWFQNLFYIIKPLRCLRSLSEISFMRCLCAKTLPVKSLPHKSASQQVSSLCFRCSHREMRGLYYFGERVMANLDQVCLNNQSHYSLDIIEFQSELCDTQSAFTDPIGMNGKCRKLNPTCRKKSVTSLIKQHFFQFKNSSIQKYCLV